MAPPADEYRNAVTTPLRAAARENEFLIATLEFEARPNMQPSMCVDPCRPTKACCHRAGIVSRARGTNGRTPC